MCPIVGGGEKLTGFINGSCEGGMDGGTTEGEEFTGNVRGAVKLDGCNGPTEGLAIAAGCCCSFETYAENNDDKSSMPLFD